jgi:flagellar biosynthetic protein FlhB
MAEDSQERTERASQRRRDEVRKGGNVPRSREVTTAALMIASVFFLYFGSTVIIHELKSMLAIFWNEAVGVPMSSEMFQTTLNRAMLESLKIVVPVMGFFGIISALSVVGQTGLIWTGIPFTPQWQRINPFAGFRRIFSFPSTAELVKGLVKLALVGWISYRLIRKDLPVVIEAADSGPDRLLLLAVTLFTRLFLWVGVATVFLAAVDYLFQIWNFERSIRMTRQEIKEENRQSDMNPQIRTRIRTIQRTLSRKRMMADVPKADVIITNPTHLAVALLYRSEEMGAPVVIAKGAGEIAAKIREIARSHQVPVLENKPLARTLFRNVKVGAPIPTSLYKAVAEVLAYVYRLRGRRVAGNGAPEKKNV